MMAQRSRAWELVDLSWKGCVVGCVAGLGAVAFRLLIALLHNLAFFGRASVRYDVNAHTAPSAWGAGVILVPVAGALVVAFLVQRFAPEAKGHGVPEVMAAIYYRQGRIRPIVALVKALASSLSIATGGSVGREGPIAQIGSAFGSTLAQCLRLPAWQRVTLIAAGAGAGIAATFNAPIGGVLFAVELLLVEVNARTLLPVALAAVLATLVSRELFGARPSFVVSAQPTGTLVFGANTLLLLLLFGIIVGVCATLYARAIYGLESCFDAIPGGYFVRHALGMLVVGALMYALLRGTRHYYVEGVGYATVQDVLDGVLTRPGLLVLLFAAKLLATGLTLGSGASGGVFSPALFLGACLGGAYGGAVSWLFPSLHVPPLVFVVAGMAGLAGSAMGAALTAVTMLFEMTRSYDLVLPMIATVAIAYSARRVLMRESIYTFKLVRRGDHVSEALMTEFPLVQAAWSLADRRVARVPPGIAARDALRLHPEARFFVVGEHGEVCLAARRGELLEALVRGVETNVDAVAERCVRIDASASMRSALARLRAERATIGLVRGREGALGVVVRETLSPAVDCALDLMER